MSFAFSRIEGSSPLVVSVIIPALNESATLGQVIAAIRSEEVGFETMVVDAQSSDASAAIARAAGARVISCKTRQRAHQLNLGAGQARGEILLFLHADTFLPARALDEIVSALRTPSVAGGGFARRYASPSWLLRMTCFLTRCRNRTIGWHLGDQAIFVRRQAFEELGGFREVERFEDLDFSRRMKRRGHIVTLLPGVTSSPRRFLRAGPARTTLRDLLLTLRYLIHGLPVVEESKAHRHSDPAYAAVQRVGNI